MLNIKALILLFPRPAILNLLQFVLQIHLTRNISQQLKVVAENHEITELHATSVLISFSSTFKEGKSNVSMLYK